jgi:DNA-binding IclR family transcriptional regulator
VRRKIMYIDPKGHIFGYPAMRIRDLLRNLSRIEMWTVRNLEERLQVPKAEAVRVLQELQALGYVELESSHAGTELWKTTLKGNALGLASAAPPLKRTTAIRVVEQFLERVKRVNADSYYLFHVTKVVVFGSFLSNKKMQRTANPRE